MDEKNQKMVLSVRVPLTLFADMCLELEDTGQSRADFIKEAIEEKLCNDNKEILTAEIKYLEEKLAILKNKTIQVKEKEKNMKQMTEEELMFLKESKKIINENPVFLEGRINLYKNTFGKHYRISKEEFWDLMEKVK